MEPRPSHAGPGAGSAPPRARGLPGDAGGVVVGANDEVVRDRFPYTRRPLPWVLAAFVAMLFLVPVDSAELRVHLPVDSHVDRFAVAGMLLAWLVFGGDQRALLGTRRSRLGVLAVCSFIALALASIVFGAERIVMLGELKLSEKHFALLLSFLVLFWFTMTALRFEDLRGFATLLIGLGTFTAFWMVIERRTGYNFFFEWSRTVLGPVARVLPPLTQIHPTGGERPVVVGPTRHGLAATTMMVVVMPFALVRVFDGLTRRTRWLNAAAFVLMFAAAMATSRKTALLVPVALIVYVAFYRPRQMLKLLPVGLIAAFALVHVLAPGSIGSIVNVGRDVESNSTVHRSGDFSALSPDVHAHPIIGRGYGSVSEEQPSEFRINDDQYLDVLWEVGILGLIAYAGMILAPVAIARKAIRSRDPTTSSLALAASGGCVAFLVVCALFDALSFPQAPYMLFVVAALTTIAAAGPAGNTQRPPAELARRIGRPRPAVAT